MRPISEVLRLAAQGRSRREIGIRSVPGWRRPSVHRYHGARAAGGGELAVARRPGRDGAGGQAVPGR